MILSGGSGEDGSLGLSSPIGIAEETQGTASFEGAELDRLVIDLVLGLPVPEEVRLTSGVFSLVLVSAQPFEKSLLEKNEPLNELMPDLRRRNEERLSSEAAEGTKPKPA